MAEGYAAFTVSATSRDAVREYIAGQEEHHRKVSFQEYRECLNRCQIQYHERHVRD